MAKSVRILVTGFEPFAGSVLNPSREVLEPLAATAWEFTPFTAPGLPAIEIRTALLPVVGGTANGSAHHALRRAIDSMQGAALDALLCLGETGARDSVCVERVAVNRRDYRIPDNAGARVSGEAVITGAGDELASTLPVDDLVKAARAAGVRTEASTDAGCFLCNEIMFHAIALASAPGSRIRRAGFVHVPQFPEQLAERVRNGDKIDPSKRTGMTFAETLTAIQAIVARIALLDSKS